MPDRTAWKQEQQRRERTADRGRRRAGRRPSSAPAAAARRAGRQEILMSCNCPVSSEICTRQSENRKCLLAAVEQGSNDVVQYLFETLGVGTMEDICRIRNKQGKSFLMVCVEYCREDILQYALDRMQDRNARRHVLNDTDQNGNTALILASSLGHVDIAKSLLLAGASLRIRNKMSIDAIQEAKDRQNLEMLRYLLKVQDDQQKQNQEIDDNSPEHSTEGRHLPTLANKM